MLRLTIRQHMILVIAVKTRQFLPRRIHRNDCQRKIALFVASEIFHRGIVADGGLILFAKHPKHLIRLILIIQIDRHLFHDLHPQCRLQCLG